MTLAVVVSVGVVAQAPGSAARVDGSTGPAAWFAPRSSHTTRPEQPGLHSSDFMQMFTPGSRWTHAAAHDSVFEIDGEWVTTATDAQLHRVVRDLQGRGIPLAVA